MAWTPEKLNSMDSIVASGAVFPEIETDYVDPVLGRSLKEHLKTYWLIRLQRDYKDGYAAAKVCELEPEKFTLKDWKAIGVVCGYEAHKLDYWANKKVYDYQSATA